MKTFVCNLRSGSDAWSVSPGRAYTEVVKEIEDLVEQFTYEGNPGPEGRGLLVVLVIQQMRRMKRMRTWMSSDVLQLITQSAWTDVGYFTSELEANPSRDHECPRNFRDVCILIMDNSRKRLHGCGSSILDIAGRETTWAQSTLMSCLTSDVQGDDGSRGGLRTGGTWEEKTYHDQSRR